MDRIFFIKQGWILFALAVIYAIEHGLPFYLDRTRMWKHDLRNIVIGVMNVGITTLLFSSLTVFVTAKLAEQDFGLLRALDLPVAVKIIGVIIFLDLFMYWWHRFNHVVPFLWLFHRVHHSDPAVDVSSSFRFHLVEVSMSLVGRLGLIALLGIDSFYVFIYEMIFSPIVYFHHSNICIGEKVDAIFRLLAPSPHMHRIHHSIKPAETNTNYGSVLSLWDRIFGTFALVDDPRQIVQGLKKFQDASTQTIPGMIKTPFVKS